MPISRDALYIFSQPDISSGPIPDIILATQGSYDTTEGATLYPNSFGTTISASATLTYATVLVANGVLFATDPVTGLPGGVATLPDGFRDLVSLGGFAIATGAYDSAGDVGLLRTDGTFDGTVFIIPPGSAPNFAPQALGRLGNIVLFGGLDTKGALGLWRTDGTVAGTYEIATSPAFPGGATQFLGVANGRALFAASGTIVSSDGTTGGTHALAGNFAALSSRSQSAGLSNGALVITDGASVYVTNGTNTPVTIASYNAPVNGLTVTGLVAFGSRAAYLAHSVDGQGNSSESLVVTDGSSGGTVTIAAAATITALTTFGSQLLFAATDHDGSGTTGLWISDGTAAGTHEIAAAIDPTSITVDGIRAFVAGIDPNKGNGLLFTTDGTSAGTTDFLHANAAGSTFTSGVLDPTHLFVTGSHDQYEVAPGSVGELNIVDTVPGRDGAASDLAHIVSFDDGTGVLDTTGNAEALARIYQSAFDRAPDIGGLIAYTTALDAGSTTLLQVANIGAASPEFIGLHGDTSNAGFVTALYQNTVGRLPDAGGLASYVADLNGGESRGAVLLDISQSFEARHDGLGVAGQANDATIYRLYETVVDRAPDLAGQQAYSAALSAGTSVQTIASAMLASGEYASVFGNPSNGQFVSNLYENLLHRPADAGGLATYSADLANGTSRAALVAAFVGSDDGRLATAQATHDGWVFLG